MSRGLGRVERHVLDTLRQAPVAAATVVLLMRQSPGLTEPSLRRALASLKRKKLIAPMVATGEKRIIWWQHVEAARERELRRQNDAEKLRKETEKGRRARARQDREDEEAERRYFENMAKLGLEVKRPPCNGEVRTLAGILGMLGSDHDGECLAAARKAEAARRKTGRTWLQLLGLDK